MTNHWRNPNWHYHKADTHSDPALFRERMRKYSLQHKTIDLREMDNPEYINNWQDFSAAWAKYYAEQTRT